MAFIVYIKSTMPIAYTIDQELQTVFTRVWGCVIGDDMFDQQESLKKNPLFDPHMKELISCLDQENTDMDTVDKMFVVANSPWGQYAKRAIVANTTLTVGLSRMFQIHMTGEHGEIEVFSSIPDARRWLGLY